MSFIAPNKILSVTEKIANQIPNFPGFKSEEIILRQRLKYSEIVPTEELFKHQLQKLRSISRAAYRLPFFKNIFTENDLTPEAFVSVKDLSKLPVLRKTDFRCHAEKEYIDFELGKKRGYWVRTSGSTGEPFRIMRDNKYLTHVKIYNLRFFKWFGIDVNSRKANFIVPWGTPSAWGSPANDKYLTIDDFQNKVKRYADFLDWYKPAVLESNPSYLVYFAKYLSEQNRKIHIPYLLSYGEHLFDDERRVIEKTFSGKVINRYGLTEITNLGVECPRHHGFHLNALGCLLEIVDNNGMAVSEDEEGEIVVTSLINEITPILRYGTGDRGRWIKESCPCGLTYPRFSVSGRRDDTLKLADGRIIYMNFFHPIFYKHMGKIRQFQIVQKSEKEIIARIAPTSDFTDENEKVILKDLKNLLGKDTVITISIEDSISWEKSGKYKSVVKL